MNEGMDIDENLLSEAQRLSGKSLRSDVINEALREFVKRKKQDEILRLFGSVDFDPKYEYKKYRRMR